MSEVAMSLVTSPDSIVFGPDRPKDRRDKAIEIIMPGHDVIATCQDETHIFSEGYSHELVYALEAPVGDSRSYGESIHSILHSLHEGNLQVR